MEKIFNELLISALKNEVSDIHFILKDETLKISMRGNRGIINVKKTYPASLLHYLKYISHLDLGNADKAQSGNFKTDLNGNSYYFRFSYIHTHQLDTAVLRILNNHKELDIEDLSKKNKQNQVFKQWCQFRSGLIIISGPTGSGKTTTLHAILETIAKNNKLKVISLEDPIEIYSDHYLQLQINENINFDYEEGIRQLLRHDPDVIMIGEVRDQKTALSLIRCALSGHMVFTTLHAKSCKEAMLRLLDLGVSRNDLKEVLTALTNQRIFPSKNRKGRVCVYEILQKEDIHYFFEKGECREEHKDIFDEIMESVEQGYISKKEAKADLSI